jgi:hypothetical protein
MMASISPSPEAPMLQDMHSPIVGEKLCIRRCLCKSRKKICRRFSGEAEALSNEGVETVLKAQTGMGGSPSRGGRATLALLALVAPLSYFFDPWSLSS